MRPLKKKHLFLFLLPVFFVFHGFTENYDVVPAGDAILLLFIYLLAALLLTLLSWLLFHDLTKAILFATLLLGYNFLFGSIQDGLRKYFAGTFFHRYIFILPVSIVLIAIIYFAIKRSKSSFGKLSRYLNTLFLLLIIIDAGWLFIKILRGKDSPRRLEISGYSPCDTCKKPDVFFVILDEYSGNTALRDRFNFDNSEFENALRKRGFYVATNSSSNYNYTPFSMASMLNMSYLDLNMKTKGPGNLLYCYRMIRNNRVTQFMEGIGYHFYNYSIFDFKGNPAIKTEDFLPSRSGLITAQTFVSRLWDDILFNVGTGKWNIQSINRRIVYSHLHNNENLSSKTLRLAGQKSASSKFVYTHLVMPHYPYYFDSHGNEMPFDSLLEGRQQNKNNYLEYLQYCNEKILRFTDSLMKASTSPPIIILAGDHGFREFTLREDRPYCFMNLTAVYLPSGNYSNFYNRMSCINLFPIILNNQFNQHIPLQKDSTIYLWD